MTLSDPSLPHQIQLVFASKTRRCLNGEVVKHMEVAVTCNCYRIGESDGFWQYIGPAPTPEIGWEQWNKASLHKDRATFTPRLREVT